MCCLQPWDEATLFSVPGNDKKLRCAYTPTSAQHFAKKSKNAGNVGSDIFVLQCASVPMPPATTTNNADRADSTRELVSRAQAGDVHAFEVLLAEHIPQVRRFARAFANNEADADDLAQEALVKVYRSLQSFRFQSAFGTWLYTLVRNSFLDVVRSRSHKERSAQSPLDHERDQTDNGETPADEALILSEQHATVWAAIRRVPTEFQTAIVLFEVEGMSHEEIARIENVAIGTVKSRLSRARQHLRAILVDDPRARHTPTGNPHGLNVVSPKEAQ